MDDIVAPVFQRYVYGGVAPETETEASPLLDPQVASVCDCVTENAEGSLIVKLITTLHPLASVIVTS